ncbi:hypothetical protein BC830DRAFT_1145799 [Chytriomyces sp. MP71]|nr:hypothetical protein BC830DRAFT_1145799 [Chytriomyces sp. MP71]
MRRARSLSPFRRRPPFLQSRKASLATSGNLNLSATSSSELSSKASSSKPSSNSYLNSKKRSAFQSHGPRRRRPTRTRSLSPTSASRRPFHPMYPVAEAGLLRALALRRFKRWRGVLPPKYESNNDNTSRTKELELDEKDKKINALIKELLLRENHASIPAEPHDVHIDQREALTREELHSRRMRFTDLYQHHRVLDPVCVTVQQPVSAATSSWTASLRSQVKKPDLTSRAQYFLKHTIGGSDRERGTDMGVQLAQREVTSDPHLQQYALLASTLQNELNDEDHVSTPGAPELNPPFRGSLVLFWTWRKKARLMKKTMKECTRNRLRTMKERTK